MSEPRPVYRIRRFFTALLWLLSGLVIILWTLRAVSPERAAPDEPRTVHYLPVQGQELFTLSRSPTALDAYAVESAIACLDANGHPVVELRPDDVMSCASGRAALRLRLDSGAGSQALVIDGFQLSVGSGAADELAVVGLAKRADVVLPLPGVGAEHARILAPSACALPGGELPDLCVENGGLRGSLVIDSAQRLADQADPKGMAAPLRRRAPGRGEALPLLDGDWLWLGQIPLVVRKSRESGGVQIYDFVIPGPSIDLEDWREVSGQRRWMNLEIPSWSLGSVVETDAGWVREGPEHFEFLGRELLFSTSPNPFAWDMHLDDRRVEWEQEEQLQRLIDREFLCLESDFDPRHPPAGHQPFPARLGWNLVSGLGCDGASIPPAELELFRLAGELAHNRETNERLGRVAHLLRALPDEIPNPGELGFVFDWAPIAGEADELAVVPVRLLGVRPLSTFNGPSRESRGEALEDECDLAGSDWAKPPISTRKGSTSPRLRVERSDKLAPNTQLLLIAEGSICVGATIPGSDSHPQLGSVRLGKDRATILLGHLGLSKGDAQWSSKAQLQDEGTVCARFERSDAGWSIRREGAGGELSVREAADGSSSGMTRALSTGEARPLAMGQLLRISHSGEVLELRVQLEANPDLVAYTEIDDGQVRRRYPFGEDLAAFLGVEGKVWGGIESWLEPELLVEARERWADSCANAPVDVAAIELTLRGDLQRIIYAEVERVQREQQLKVTKPTENEDGEIEAHEIVRIQAVLMDATSGDLLAVVNAPSVDPENQEELRRLQDSQKRRDGRWQTPANLENLAFRRSANIGSVYKLATSYAMARAGLFEQEGPAPTGAACWRLGFRESSVFADGSIETRPPPSQEPSEGERVRCSSTLSGTQVLGLGRPSDGYLTAFTWSHNTYFSLATLALAPSSGIRFQLSPRTSLGSGGAQILERRGQHGMVQELIFEPGFSVRSDLGWGNALFETLVALGHRYHYGSYGSQWLDEVNGTRFAATDETRWLPGIQVGGFWYPSVTGPENYDMERGIQDLSFQTKRGADEDTVERQVRTNHVSDYAKIGYGMGGIQSNALALAVIATPVVAGGDVISPDLLVGEDTRRVMTPGLLKEEHRARVETAMKSVVREGTAKRYFPDAASAWPGLGGKTGTFDTGATSRPVDDASTGELGALRRVTDYACGRAGASFALEDWQALERIVKLHVSRAYVVNAWSRIVNDNAAPGLSFGAGAEVCLADNPNRVGVSANLGDTAQPIDGGTWLDAVHAAAPNPDIRSILVSGSSLVTVMFEGVVPNTGAGKGWILSVVSDGRAARDSESQIAAKLASAAIWLRLVEYLEMQAL